MITLVPVSRFRVRYEVAAGRPYSKFETLVLAAVAAGASTLDALTEIFCIHPRLVIEALVTLTQAGWLAVGEDASVGFVLTADGRAASAKATPISTVVTPRQTYVVMERLTGAVVASQDVYFVSRSSLGEIWDQTLRLRPQFHSNRLDEGEIGHLLPRRQGERIRWIGPIDQDTKGASWLALDVDVADGTVVNLPDVWAERLRDSVLIEARRRRRDFRGDISGSPTKAPRARRGGWRGIGSDPDYIVPKTEWPAQIDESDFLIAPDDHTSYLQRQLDTDFSGGGFSVLIASPTATAEELARLEPYLRKATASGAKVDILFGELTQKVSEAAKRIAWDVRANDHGILRFAAQGSSSSLALTLVSGPRGSQACLGSFPWLGPQVDDAPLYASVATSCPGLVAALIRSAASNWATLATERLSSTPDRWRRHAMALESEAERLESECGPKGNCRVSITRNLDTAVMLQKTLGSNQTGVTAWTTVLGQGAQDWADAAVELDVTSHPPVDIVFRHYGSGEGGSTRLTAAAEKVGFRLRHTGRSCAHVLMVEDMAVVSSSQPLGDRVGSTARGKFELGILVRGAEPVNFLRARLSDLG